MPSQAPAHWSKDFAEHLRTVHFALVAVSAGLLVLIFSSKSYNPAIAIRELEEIIEFQNLWSPEWLRENFKEVRQQESLETNLSLDIEARSPEYRHDNLVCLPLKTEAQAREVLATSHRLDKTSSYIFVLPETEWFSVRNATSEDGGVPPDLGKVPKTLADFGKWWNSLLKSREIGFPISIDPVGKVALGMRYCPIGAIFG
jgi:hypothetical protein